MRMTFVRAFVVGCGLLVTCELGHADALTGDPACLTRTTWNPPQQGPVTCYSGNSANAPSFPANGFSPVSVLDNLTEAAHPLPNDIETFPSDKPTITMAITSQEAISFIGNNVVATSGGTLNNVAFTMRNGAAFTGLRFTIATLVPDLTITVVPVDNATGAVLAPVVFTPGNTTNSSYSIAANNTLMMGVFPLNTGFSLAEVILTSDAGFPASGVQTIRLGGPFRDEGFTEPVQPPFVPEIETPEPDTLSLLGFSLAGFGLCFRKFRRRFSAFNDFRPSR